MLQLLPQNVDKNEKAYLEEELKSLWYDIEAFAGHVVRACVQGEMPHKLVEDLGNDTLVSVVDWAMKWLAKYLREMQEKVFAKAGINWHQAVVIFKDGKIRGYVHVVDESTQKATQVFTSCVMC